MVLSLLNRPVNAQGLLNKMKQKAAEAAEKALDKKTDELINGKKQKQEDGNSSSVAQDNSGGSAENTSAQVSANGPRNKGGAGLVTTPPDVKENLNSTESALKASNYSDARYALKQAILGVEMEIGQELLKSLPENISGLPKQTDKDQVISTGWGLTGLSIHREYMKEDKQVSMTIANNAIMMNAINLFLNNGAFGQTTSSDQNWKQTKLKGNKAIIQFDQSTGYKLSVPLGQSTLIVFEGINMTNEQEMMQAVEQFNVDAIKKTLGEK